MNQFAMDKIKIFVSAYACEPGLGSEIGVGWHWVLEMSKHFELWVLTRESNRGTIEPWIAAHPEFAGIHFLYFDLPKWARFWKKGLRGVRTYYNIWQYCTNSIVKRTMQKNEITIYHLLTYGNALWPVSRYGKKQFFIWGPTSVGTSTPADFSKHYSFFSRLKEVSQRLIKRTLSLNYGFKNRCRHANIILCKTDETIECVPNEFKHKCIQFTDVAVERKEMQKSSTNVRKGERTRYFSAGTLVGWRNFDILIEAFARASIRNKDIELVIVGGGKEMGRLKKLAKERNVQDFIRFTGQLNMHDYNTEIQNCDVVVNSCFREGGVTVSFDSMSFGKPLICFDTGGYTHYFKDEYSIVIKGINKREDAIARLAESILELSDKEVAHKMGRKALETSRNYYWERKGEIIHNIISDCYYRYESNNHS